MLARSANALPFLLPLEPPPPKETGERIITGEPGDPQHSEALSHWRRSGPALTPTPPEIHSFCTVFTLTVLSCFQSFLLHKLQLSCMRRSFGSTCNHLPLSGVCVKALHGVGMEPRGWGEKLRRARARSIPTMRHQKRNRQIRPRCWCHLAA